MARIRTVKDGFFKNEVLAGLGAYAMLLFEGLWLHSDREGRLEDRPRRLKIEILPYFDDANVEEILQALHDNGFILRYSVDDKAYIWVKTFRNHQRITGSEAESKSKIPAPPGVEETPEKPSGEPEKQPNAPQETPENHSGNTEETLRTTGKEGKGEERIGKEGEDPAPNGADGEKTPSPASSDASLGPPFPMPEGYPEWPTGDEPFHRACRVIMRVHATLRTSSGNPWKPPRPQDVRQHLKPDCALQTILTDYGEDGAVEIFLQAAYTWKNSPTWATIMGQRHDLAAQVEAGKQAVPQGSLQRRPDFRKHPEPDKDFKLRMRGAAAVKWDIAKDQEFDERQWYLDRKLVPPA